MENHKSRLLVDVGTCDNGAYMVLFPPQCSHRLQLLDMAIFGPLKAFYYSVCYA